MTEPSPSPGFARKARPFIWFLLANIVCGLFVFRGGLWGDAMLAPLDILPAICSKYKFMDPDSSGVPANHFIVDQVSYDLPVQFAMYNAYRSGEIPWWDPYEWAGRPMLAEAHVNGTEPIRLLTYFTLPFEAAYNWARILNFLFCGFSMLVLLRYLRFPEAPSVLLALGFEFAGGFVLYFGHPWVQAAFNYYPLIWVAWDAWFRQRNRWSLPLSTLAMAGVFYAGNLQSHAYVILFAGAILLGYGGLSWSRWRVILPIVAASGILGATLAAPVVIDQVVLYERSTLKGEWLFLPAEIWGLTSVFAVYPWALGTFRTLDLGKLCVTNDSGFFLFMGSVAFLLALLGAMEKPAQDRWFFVKRASLWLVAVYLFIVCTPLLTMLYHRTAGLGLLGLTVLAALGFDALLKKTEPLRRWGKGSIILVIVLVVCTHVGAFLIYPKYVPKIREMVHAMNARTPTGMSHARKLRDFQVDNLANEVSFKNPETIIACLGILGFAGVCLVPTVRRKTGVMPALLVLNLVPLLMFAHRYVPVHSIGLWQRLMAEGTEQRRVAAILNDGNQRLIERGVYFFNCLYPNSLCHLYKVRTTYGYSSLQPSSFSQLGGTTEAVRLLPQAGDYIYDSPPNGGETGTLIKNPTPGSARFQWLGGVNRGFHIAKETMNEIHLAIEPGPEEELMRTDTYWPGWSAIIGSQQVEVQRTDSFFTKVKVPAGAQTLVFHYEPIGLRPGLKIAGVGLIVLMISSIVLIRLRPRLVSA